MNTEVFAGTYQFMAPEVIASEKEYDACKVDNWACGITLYNMITGRLPYDICADEGPLVLYEKIINAPLEMPEEAEHDLELVNMFERSQYSPRLT